MKSLSILETGLVLRLLLYLDNRSEIDIAAHGQPLLHLKKGNTVRVEQEKGYLFYAGVRLNRKREAYVYHMGFVVVDNRQCPGVRSQLAVYPISYRDDVNGLQDISCILQHDEVSNHRPALQINLVATASRWLQELKTNGYITGAHPLSE